MIKSASQQPVHALLSHEGNVQYQVPPYQRAYSWQKAQWEDLVEDLLEADGAHFLGTIITVNQSTNSVDKTVLELVDGQQRMTTLTLLLAAIYSVLKDNYDDLDDDTRVDVTNLGRRIVRKGDGESRLLPQVQGSNRDDYSTVLADVGLTPAAPKKPYFGVRRISKCFNYFRDAIEKLADTEGTDEVKAATRILDAVQQAVLVNIEVANHADAFVLFESLNNRGMPLTPVDLIKTHLLAESERQGVMSVNAAFKKWDEILTNLGDSSATHERFLRQFYNAFKTELPDVANATEATKAKLINIYETLLSKDIDGVVEALLAASAIYGRINCVYEPEVDTDLDRALRQLLRAQGAPSYILVLWLMTKRIELGLDDGQLADVVRLLTSFFVRRNLTSTPPTYMLPRMFMSIIDKAAGRSGADTLALIREQLVSVSASDAEFRDKLLGPVYAENVDVTRFILVTLSEDAMTKESWQDLWVQGTKHYEWTIEHILPQGSPLPKVWQDMLGGPEIAAAAQESDVHRLGNLTITAYNSNLGNKSFADKRDRTDAKGRPIGYRNGLALNEELVGKDSWTVSDIQQRTQELADRVVSRFQV